MAARASPVHVRFGTIREELEPGRVERLRWSDGGAPLTHARVHELWQGDAAFVDAFAAALAASSLGAFFWETPPVDRARLPGPFECVLVASRSLAGLRPDPGPFDEHLRGAAGDVADFWNLGGDALLVAPTLAGPPGAYAHLAAFLRAGPREQVRALWRRVGTCVGRRVGERPLWVSTSGLGVAWLHVRLDAYPKYYQHAPYRDPEHGVSP
jgi:hypothetical protein